MQHRDELRTRIDDLAARAGAGQAGTALLREIEDVLAQGYADALRLDAERRRLDRRTPAGAGAMTDTSAVARLRMVDRSATELRACLGVLRKRYVALGGTRISG